MIQRLKVYFTKRYLPRWLILFFDLCIVLISFVVAYTLRFNFDLDATSAALHPLEFLLISPVFLMGFLIVRTYAGIMRHSTMEDITRIVFALSLSGAFLALFSFFTRQFVSSATVTIPYSVIVIQFALASNILLTSRLLAKTIYNEWITARKNVKKVMIYGTGNLGQVARRAVLMDDTAKVKLVGFIDDNKALYKKRSAGIPIFSLQHTFEKITPKHNIDELIIAIDKADNLQETKRKIVDLCLPFHIEVKEVPSVENWINGKLRASEIKKINIEDLLGREPIQLDLAKIKEGVKDTVVFVAGAAGSIGSEIVRQLAAIHAWHVVLIDKAESDLYDLQNEIIAKYKNAQFTIVVGDVTNKTKMRKLFKEFSPSVVLNAAAYKHVPLMEEYPGEAIRVNVGGTKVLADLSLQYGVEKFVFISTDKAVNPTNVMGASKRIAEIYVQSLAQKNFGNTQFITTRFGNVLGSNGSVVPLFKKQIAVGGPVTVTHKEITRFFMTIPEACQLVLEASFMGKGGEIFVFDMGEPVKIYDLAEKMIYLSGFEPNKDIEIKVTGLRPGEKLYEEVMHHQEGLLPTHNNKIRIGKVLKHNYDVVNAHVKFLIASADGLDNLGLVELMKMMVPEYISMNSPYEINNRKEDKNTLKLVKGLRSLEQVS